MSLDGLEEVAGSLETGVGAMIRLRGESHRGAVAASSAGLLVIGTTCVPCETNQDGTIAAIIIIGLVGETGSDSVVHLLVVGLGGDERPLGGGVAAQVEVRSTCGTEGTKGPDAEG